MKALNGGRRAAAEDLLAQGQRYCQEVSSERPSVFPDAGVFEAACVVEPALSVRQVDEDFLGIVMGAHPGLPDWPLWFDTRRHRLRQERPFVHQGGWQCWISGGSLGPPQFWRIEPEGRFYVRAAFEEDTVMPREMAQPSHSILDAVWRIRRLYEALRCGQAFVRVLGSDEGSTLRFAFRWTRLQGRALPIVNFMGLSWPSPLDPQSHQDICQSRAVLSIGAGPEAILSAAEEALAPLFHLFGGPVLKRQQLEEVWTRFFR